jgi:hypothetical protein
VKATKEVAFQFMISNLLNKEYSYRPMAVGAPRTFVVKMDGYILKKEHFILKTECLPLLFPGKELPLCEL